MGVIPLTTVSSSAGLNITSNASANTLTTSHQQFTASTTARIDRLTVQVFLNTTGSGRRFLLNIYTGAASSEVLLVSLPIRLASTARMWTATVLCSIPSGTRVTGKCQDDTGSGSLTVFLSGQEANSLVVQGASAGTLLTDQGSGSNGYATVVGDAGTPNTFASTSLIASTAADYNAFTLIATDGTTAASAANSVFRIKDDGVTIFEYMMKKLSNNDGSTDSLVFYHSVASGSALTAELSSTATGNRTLLVGLIGYNMTAPSSGGGAGRLVGTGGLV